VSANDIAPDALIEIEENVLFRELNGEAVILNVETGNYFGLDHVGTRAWTLIREHKALSKVVGLMEAEYEVSRDALRNDLVALAKELSAHGLVRISRGLPE
jgi:hypothetical protein